MTDYVELHAASAFSFLEGASQPDALVERAAELEMPAIAITDRNGLYGAARFHTAGEEAGIKTHIGAEIAVAPFVDRLTPPDWLPYQHPREPARIVLLCASQTGYHNLCQLITRFKMRERTKAEGAATLSDLEEFSAGLICLTGGDEGRSHPPCTINPASPEQPSSIASNPSTAAAISISNCSAISPAHRSRATMPYCASPTPTTSPSSPPTAFATRLKKTASYSTSSPPFAITPS